MALLSYKWLLLFLFGLNHPFYVSVTEISHNAQEETLEVSCKIFADDLEEILRKNYGKPVDLAAVQQKVQNDALITGYISKNLAMSADGKPVKLNYIGYEKEKESVFCYFEISGVPAFRKLDLRNSLLQDLNNQQINIMHVIVKGSRKSYKLDYPKNTASFIF
ncbi:MAG: DUF6702 family protein [Chitinophagaceae bacterium]